MIIKSHNQFRDVVSIGDIVTVRFAHKYKDKRWTDWTERQYELFDIFAEKSYLRNPINDYDILILTEGGYNIPSMIIEK